MTKTSPIPSKLSTWITMLLVWNIVLLCIALFYLFMIVRSPLHAEDLAAQCAEAIRTSTPFSLPTEL